ncbi:MAG: PAS domain S-box protein [Cyanobacteria bacterium P01_G01_bin.39]
MKQTQGKFRLRSTLVIPFILEIAVSVSIVGFLSFRAGRAAVKDLASQLRSHITERIDQYLDSYLSAPYKLNRINLEAFKLGLLDLEDFKKTGHYFWVQMQQFDVGYVNYGNEEGEFIGVERLEDNSFVIHETVKPDILGMTSYQTDSQGNCTTSEYDPETGDVREEDWYSVAVKVGHPVWSDIYQWQDKPEILSISSSFPVFNSEKKLLGVIGVDLILSQIGDFLNQLEISPSAKIYIMERDGRLVARSGTDLPYEIVAGEPQRIHTADSPNPIVEATTNHLLQEYQSLNKITEAIQTEFEIDGERQFVQVTPWQDELGLDWLIAVTVPESDFMEQINANTRNTILLCLAALGIAIAIGIYTSSLITHPIKRVSNASDELARGELDQQVKSSPIVEVDTLASSFNSMAQQLRSTFDTLQESESRFRGLVDNIPGAIYRCQCDAKWTMTYISDSIATISGYSASELIENQVRTYTSIIHPEDRHLVEDAILQAISKQEPYMVDYRLIHKDSSIHWVYERGQAIFDRQGNTLYLDGVIFDISDRKRAEEALRITEENYRSIFENALEGIFQSSPEGQFTRVNPAMAKIFGYDSPEEMLANFTNIAEQLHVDPENQDIFVQSMSEQDRVMNFEYRTYQKDGNIIWVQEDTRAVRDKYGTLLCYEGILQDVTERKQREAELRKQLQELKIEIDQNKRVKDVATLTQSSFFQEVQEEVAEVDLDEFWS